MKPFPVAFGIRLLCPGKSFGIWLFTFIPGQAVGAGAHARIVVFAQFDEGITRSASCCPFFDNRFPETGLAHAHGSVGRVAVSVRVEWVRAARAIRQQVEELGVFLPIFIPVILETMREKEIGTRGKSVATLPNGLVEKIGIKRFAR